MYKNVICLINCSSICVYNATLYLPSMVSIISINLCSATNTPHISSNNILCCTVFVLFVQFVLRSDIMAIHF